MSEGDLHKQVIALLKYYNVPVCHSRFAKRSTITIGWPDITFCILGNPIAWELKVGKNGLSNEQRAIRANMERHGWQYRVIRTLEEAESHLREVVK
jgi:hypothetical protein